SSPSSGTSLPDSGSDGPPKGLRSPGGGAVNGSASVAPAVLAVADLHKSYGSREVLRGPALAVARGGCYGLLGPQRAGKTTTLRLALGLIEPASGSVSLLGLPVPEAARRARIRVGVVPQMDNLDPDFTVSENLLVYGRYFGLADRTI